ncbi:MAG TPA: DUF488 domain-containing protein [Kiloniellales bacterium]|nr:DUF488 domain-containing protein [Kiloniellales bacterium]
MASFTLKRVYDPPQKSDGLRILVDRLWPRGLKKEAAAIDIWCKDLAPSSELRRWFHHDPDRWEAFAERYRKELVARTTPTEALLEQVGDRTATLLYGARDRERNHALVLLEFLTDFSK